MNQAAKVQVTLDARYKPWLCCAEDSARPTLAGVFLDPAGYMVAGDGFCLVVVPCKIISPGAFNGTIVPGEFLAQLHRESSFNQRHDIQTVTFSIDMAAERVEGMTNTGHSFSWPLIHGVYPGWRKPISKREGLKPSDEIAFDAALAIKLCAALDTGQTTRLLLSGPHGVMLMVAEEAFGLMMPMSTGLIDKRALDRILALGESVPVEAK